MIGKRTKYINQVAVKCIKDAVRDGQFTIDPVALTSICRISIDKCSFVISADGSFYLVYAEDVNKEYVDMWRDDVGGVLRKDLKSKTTDVYFEITTYGTRVLVRKVDEEIDSDLVLRFKSDNMIQCGDFLYLPIKIIPKNSDYKSEHMDYNNIIEKEEEPEEKKDAKKGAMDEDFGFGEEYEDEYRYSKEDEDIENYYIPKDDF